MGELYLFRRTIALLMREFRLQYSNIPFRFRTSERQMRGVSYFSTKLVAWQYALRLAISEKEVQIDLLLHPKRFHSLKRLRKLVQ